MNSKNKIILFALLILTVTMGFLNLRIYYSYVDQFQTLGDFNNQNWDFNNFENMEVDFPNFSVTSMHLKSVKARYLLKNKRFDEALALLEPIEFDPLKMSEAQKAEAYFLTGDLVKMYESAELAFNSLPNNHSHLIWYLKALRTFNKESEITDLYDKYVNKYTSTKWLYMYFSAAYGIMDDSNQEIITKQAKDTYQRQSKKDDKELNVILTYVLFGEENFKSAEKYSKKATKLFSNNEFDKAAKNYQNAIKMIPINPDHYYNRMAALYKLNNHLEIEETFKSLPDSINPRNGQFEFLMARSYLNIKDTLKACEFFNTSKNYNYAKSTSYLKNLCLK